MIQKSTDTIVKFLSHTSSFEDWADSKKVEKLIKEMGINGEKPHELPQELIPCMGGIRAWVMPVQTAPYLSWLHDNGPFDSYLEIGTRFGGTFMLTCEALRSKNKNLWAVGCDIICQPIELKTYMSIRGFEYLHGSSGSDEFKKMATSRRWGVCLVDGSHKYEDVVRDFEIVNGNADVIVFHDVCSDACPGVVKIWEEMKTKHPYRCYEFTKQYFTDKSYMGIGILDLR